MAALDGINRSGKGKVWYARRGECNSPWLMGNFTSWRNVPSSHITDFRKTQTVSCKKRESRQLGKAAGEI